MIDKKRKTRMPSGTNKVLNLFIKLYSNVSLCNSVKVVVGRYQTTWIQGHLFHHLQPKFRPDFPKPELGKLKFVYC